MVSHLEVKDLRVAYSGKALALSEITLAVAPGQVVGVLGANGAGKTTLLRAISGFIGAESATILNGSVTFDGRRLTGCGPDAAVRAGIVLVPERNKVFATLTVGENFTSIPLFGSKARRAERMAFALDLFPVLGDRLHQPAGLLSGGERQMLALARALLMNPRVLLVDELSFGLAPALVIRMVAALKRIQQEEEFALLIVEQNATSVFDMADYVYVLEAGRVTLQGSAGAVRSNPKVTDVYFGLSSEDGPA